MSHESLADALDEPCAPEMVPVGDVSRQGGVGYQHVLPCEVLGEKNIDLNKPPGLVGCTLMCSLSGLPLVLLLPWGSLVLTESTQSTAFSVP